MEDTPILFYKCLLNKIYKNSIEKFRSKNNGNLLHVACAKNKMLFLRILALICNINHKDNNGMEPLDVAIIERHIECIKELMLIITNKANY